jgi:hypothetical protein
MAVSIQFLLLAGGHLRSLLRERAMVR